MAEGKYDWNRLAGERWFLRAAKARGVKQFGFTIYSPPMRRTRNGLTHHGTDTTSSTNLKPGAEAAFADYLTDMLVQFRDHPDEAERVEFDRIFPHNEPKWDWQGSQNQEGNQASNEDIRRVRTMWQQAGPQIMLGHSLAWGQYVIGIALTLFLLTPVWDAHPATGALLEISFVGGHGTVAGMSEAFSELGFEEATDIGLGLATVGVIAGALIGTVLVNWAARNKIINLKKEDESETGAAKEAEPKRAKWLRTLSVHLALIGVAIVIGWLLQQLLIWTEENTWGDRIELFRYTPLFPLAMIGALIVQVSLDRFGLGETLDRKLVNRISAGSLDILITSALATLSLAAIGEFLVPFLLLALAAVTWNVVGFLYLAPRMIPKHWFERGAGDFGQSIGMAALGLLLIQLADPHNRSGAKQRFGYKQVLFEPVVGGGLFTAASAPLLVQLGSVWMLIGTFILTAAFISGGLWLFRQNAEG